MKFFQNLRKRCNVMQAGMLDTSNIEINNLNFFSNGKDEKKDLNSSGKNIVVNLSSSELNWMELYIPYKH